MSQLPYSAACENNKAPILDKLAELFAQRERVLEIASGTGQHACFFAAAMPQLQWQPTELEGNLAVLTPRCSAYEGENLLPPLVLDVRRRPWPLPVPEAVFTANSFHIMAFSAVAEFFAELGERAAAGTLLVVYGPFNYGGRYTSDSNAQFDRWLAQQYTDSAIRDFERVDALACQHGFELQHDFEMPANNRLIAWSKR